MRLDLAVSHAFGLSRRVAREAVRSGRIDVDGATVNEPGQSIAAEARLEHHPERPARRRVRTRLSVLYEDGDLLIVDKPSGLLTVPTASGEKDTLWSRALHYLQHRYGGRPYAGIVHRLDKDTSGALVFARNRAALHSLQERFRTHAIDREYLALVEGEIPESGVFEADLVRRPGLRRSVAKMGEVGRRAVTRYRAIERLRGATLVSVRPETGRTHQIRVHFSAAGHPVLGDRVYGRLSHAGSPGPPRQMLHARRLAFPHPRTGELVGAESAVPEDFAAALASLRRAKRNAPAKPARLRTEEERSVRRER